MRLPKAKRDHATLERVKRAIAPMKGVQNVDVNPSTGSVVVHYDSAVHDDFHRALSEHAETHDLFALAPPHLSEIDEIAESIEREAEFLAEHSQTARAVVDFFKGLNSEIKKATNNSLDLQVLLPLGLAAYSLVALEAEVATPLWVTLGIFSFNSFVSLHHQVPTTTTDVEQSEVVRTPGPPRETRSIHTRRTVTKGES